MKELVQRTTHNNWHTALCEKKQVGRTDKRSKFATVSSKESLGRGHLQALFPATT